MVEAKVSAEEYLAVAKVYEDLIRQTYRRLSVDEEYLLRRSDSFEKIFADPKLVRNRQSCYILYRDLRQEISDLRSSEVAVINKQISAIFGAETRYTIGIQS